MAIRDRKTEVYALKLIHDHKWLRPTELGLFLYEKNSRKYASKLLAKLKKDRLIIERPLPERQGKALLLGKNGAALLRENGILAKSGKDWGTLTDKEFRPSLTYKHDLLVAATAAALVDDYDMETERNLEAYLGGAILNKVPDGLLVRWDDRESYVWLEVESARKTGRQYTKRGYQQQAGHFQKLINALVDAARGTKWGVAGREFKIKGACVAYDINAKNELGHKIDHRGRIERAIKAQIASDIEIMFVGLELSPTLVVHAVHKETVTLHSDKQQKLLNELVWHKDQAGSETTQERRYRLSVQPLGGSWVYRIDNGELSKPYNTILEAKKACISAVIPLL
jgi:hypothetical protein